MIQNYDICKTLIGKTSVSKLHDVYEILTSSRDPQMSFLASQDAVLFLETLSECANEGLTGQPIYICGISRVISKANSISLKTTVEGFKTDLRSSKFLDLSLVATYPKDFVGISASWTGYLEQIHFKSGSLTGRIYSFNRKISFPVHQANPTDNETRFFSFSNCSQGCFSRWGGKFVATKRGLVFELAPDLM